jgi:IMP cyclohydrolase
MLNIEDVLKENAYPGRGILIGKTGPFAVCAYFIMGRSENSRNRIFVRDGNGLKTQAFDPSKMSDPSLVIYSPVRVFGNKTIVTNGDQTDTIYDFLDRQKSFDEALQTREFEPDPPIFTPRISGIIRLCESGFNYALSILKSANGDGSSCRRFTFTYKPATDGIGHFIHTYKCDGNPPLSFEGEPVEVAVDGDIDDFTAKLWESLNTDNKISLYVRYINIETGDFTDRIKNKNGK